MQDEGEQKVQACKYLAGMGRKDQHFFHTSDRRKRDSDVPIYLSLAIVHLLESADRRKG